MKILQLTLLAHSKIRNSINSITIGAVDEQRERVKRKLYLIFHNVAESRIESQMALPEKMMTSILSKPYRIIVSALILMLHVLAKSDKTRL